MTDTAPAVSAGMDPMAEARDNKVRAMLHAMMSSLIDQEEELEIAKVASDNGAAFQVRAAAVDIGKLIGKSGRTARAIRVILSACAAKYGRRYTLDIGPPKS